MTRILEAQARITAKDATGGVFSQIAAKMRGIEGAAKGVNTAVAGVATRIAAVAGPTALGVLAVKSVSAFADLERRMTRIGITADESGASVRAATKDVQRLATEVAMPADKVAEALDNLVSQGKSLPEAMAYLPAVVKTAQAAGAEAKDIATTAGSIGDQMGITADKMQGAFDILVAAGKAGKFELRDMSRYLPELAPLAASVGMKGEEGLRRLASVAQVVRNQTGTAEEAAASLKNIFAKMESDETVKRFGKFGVDLRKEMAQARKEGKDLLTVFVGLADRATNGDISKIPQLFTDMEFARGMRALLTQKGAVDALVASLRNVDGSTIKDLNTVLSGTKTGLDRAKEAWDALLTRIGEGLAPAAVSTLNAITEAITPPSISGGDVVVPGSVPVATPDGSVPGAGQASQSPQGPYRRRLLDEQRGMNGFARARAAARSVDVGPTYGPGSTSVHSTASVEQYRYNAETKGGLTPGQSVNREFAIERELPEYIAKAIEQYQRRWRDNPEYRGQIEERLGRTIGALVEEHAKLTAARNGQAPPTQETVGQIAAPIVQAVTAAMSGQAEIVVRVDASEDLVAKVVSAVKNEMPSINFRINGPGSTGISSPDALATHRGRGDY